MDPLLNVFPVFFPVSLYLTYFFQHGFFCHFHDLPEDLFFGVLRLWYDLSDQIPFLQLFRQIQQSVQILFPSEIKDGQT